MDHDGGLSGREWNARTARIDVGYDVVVHCGAGDFSAKVLNLSRGGFRLDCEQPLEQGWEISADVPRSDPIKAVIRWVAGRQAGGVFVEAAAL